MAKYLLEVTYSLDGIRGVKAHGGSARAAAAAALVESLGGTLECFYFAFGGSDVFAIADLPDNEAVAAAALAVSGSGVGTTRTVVLLTPSEMDAAAQKQLTYSPPGS